MACKLHTFFTYFLTHMSSVLLVCISIERTLAVYNTNVIKKFKIPFMKKYRVEKVILLVVIVIAFINIHFLFFFNLTHMHPVSNIMSNGDTAVLLIDKNMINNSSINSSLSKSRMKTDKTFKNFKLRIKKFIIKSKKYSRNKFSSRSENEIPFELIIGKMAIESDLKKENNELLLCYSFWNQHYSYFMSYIWIYVDSLLYSILPRNYEIYLFIFISYTKRGYFLEIFF